MNGIGGFITNSRRRRAMSQRDLARVSGVSNSYICQIERGEREASQKALNKIAKGLGISPDEFNDCFETPEPKGEPLWIIGNTDRMILHLIQEVRALAEIVKSLESRLAKGQEQ